MVSTRSGKQIRNAPGRYTKTKKSTATVRRTTKKGLTCRRNKKTGGLFCNKGKNKASGGFKR